MLTGDEDFSNGQMLVGIITAITCTTLSNGKTQRNDCNVEQVTIFSTSILHAMENLELRMPGISNEVNQADISVFSRDAKMTLTEFATNLVIRSFSEVPFFFCIFM